MRPWIFDGRLPLIGSISIPGYYFWLAVAFIAVAFVVTREARREGIPTKTVLDLALIVFVGSLVGARLGWIITVKPEAYLEDPLRIFQVWRGGFVYYGGFLFNTLCMWAYIRWRRLDFWRIADVYAPALGMAICLGRMACYSAGCCFGRPADFPFGVPVPWGVTFHAGVPLAFRDIPLHPAQLYQSLLGLILFLVAMRVLRHKRYHGQAFLVTVIGYAIGRSIVEIFRADPERGVYLGGVVSTSQLISIPLVIVPLIVMAVLSRRAAAQEA
jgi:phosphatidylglycerol---prolipoprotein diacylglyceryl transferase